ncbi:MAG: DUF6941 family protein [Candidatus Sumerlaeaceae bacterium]
MAIPKLKYFLQCDEVRNEGGKFSALGMFDTIFSFIFPATHRRFFLLLGFVGAEGKYDVELQVTGPDGRNLGNTKGEINLEAADQVANVVFAFENFPLPLEGRYTLSVFLDGDFLTEQYFSARPPFPRRQRPADEIAQLLIQPDIIRSANADVQCDRCKAVYRFQQQLDPNAQVDAGFMKLPPGDIFLCAACGNRISLNQVRNNLENIVGIPKQWLTPQGQGEAATQPPPAPGSSQQTTHGGPA